MTLLCKPDDCTLLIIDVQARLMPAIHDGQTVVRRCVQLATAARELGIHVIGTEENSQRTAVLVCSRRVAQRLPCLCPAVEAIDPFSSAS